MKPVNIILTLIIVIVGFETTAQTQKRVQLIPLAIGNYWIYSTSSKSQPFDTLIIIGTRIINNDTAFEFNNGELMLDRIDSIYNYQSERIGIPFKCFQYFPFDKRTEYVIVVGGDVLNRRTASKIKGSYKLNGKEYSNCYEFKDSWESDITTICRGIGILKYERKGYVRTLVDYHVAE
jgi:hypothetical protein